MAAYYGHSGPLNQVTNLHGNLTNNTYFNTSTTDPEPAPILFRFDDPNADFTGRSVELLCLENATINHQSHQQRHKLPIVVVCGLGGIGKTQLARKFIEKNKSFYKNVIWIHSQERSSMEDEFRILARNLLQISTKVDGKEKEIIFLIGEVLTKLSSSQTVIVLDNVDETKNTEIVKAVLTVGTTGIRPHVIITSRIQVWGDSIHLLKLSVFSHEDALNYVSTKLTNMDNMHNDSLEDQKVLVKELQRFPLALRQATCHINHHRVVGEYTIGDYLQKFGSYRKEILDSKYFKDDDFNLYQDTTLTTWIVTLDAIQKCGAKGDLALRILRIAAYFHPDHIRRDIFFNLRSSLSEPEKIKVEVTEAVRLLVNYSMVDGHTQQSVLSIHRLVQQVIRIELERWTESIKTILRDGLLLLSEMEKHDGFRECYEHGISVFLQALTFDELVQDFETFPACIIQKLNKFGRYNRAVQFGNDLLPQFTTILGDDHQEAIESKFGVAQSYLQLGKYSDGLKINEEIFEKRKKLFGEDHPYTLKIKSNIAVSYINLGRYSESLEIMKDVFQKRQSILGEDNPSTLNTKYNLAVLLNSLGKYNEALQMSREVLEKRRRIIGENHPETIRCKSNIGVLYSNLGKHSEAYRIHQEVLDFRKIDLGVDHPDTLMSNFYVANSYRNMGRYSEALPIHQEVLEKRRNILGEDHPDTLKSMSLIADTYNNLGKYSDALRIHKDVFKKRKAISGNNAVETLQSKSKIAVSYNYLGKYSEALRMHEEVFEGQTLVLEENHPFTLTSKSNIADSYNSLGKSAEALKIHQNVFEKRTAILGEDHPYTLKSKSKIADSLSSLGNVSEALRLHLEICDKRKDILEEDHPATFDSKFNVAVSYSKLGQYSQALQIHQEVLQKRQTILGGDHPDTLTSKFRIGDTYSRMQKHSKALPMYEEVFQKRRSILGEDHPDTLSSKVSIDSCNRDLRARSRNTIIILSLLIVIVAFAAYFSVAT